MPDENIDTSIDQAGLRVAGLCRSLAPRHPAIAQRVRSHFIARCGATMSELLQDPAKRNAETLAELNAVGDILHEAFEQSTSAPLDRLQGDPPAGQAATPPPTAKKKEKDKPAAPPPAPEAEAPQPPQVVKSPAAPPPADPRAAAAAQLLALLTPPAAAPLDEAHIRALIREEIAAFGQRLAAAAAP